MPEVFSGLDKLTKESSDQTELLNEAVTLLSDHSRTLNSIDDQLFYLRNSLEIGFESICSRIDRSNEYLSKMVDILSNPVKTQAGEFARRANKSLQNGWYDEALIDLKKVIELDPFNYVAWYYVGVVTIEQLSDKINGTLAFLTCQKYAKPESAFYFSSASLQLALISYAEGDNNGALEKAQISFEADNSNMQAAFLLAELCSLKGELVASRRFLEICEAADIIFFLKSNNNKALKSSGVHKAVYDSATAALRQYNSQTHDVIVQSIESTQGLQKDFPLNLDNRILTDALQFSKRVSDSQDYISYRVGHDKLLTIGQKLKAVLSSVESIVQETINEVSSKIQAVPPAQTQRLPEGGLPWWGIFAIAAVLVTIVSTIGDGFFRKIGAGPELLILLMALSFIAAILMSKIYKNVRDSGISEYNRRQEGYRYNEIRDLERARDLKVKAFDAMKRKYRNIEGRNFYLSKNRK